MAFLRTEFKPALSIEPREMTPIRLTRMFYLRLGIVSFGILIATSGLYARIHGNYWYGVFNPRFGQFGTGPTLMFIFFSPFTVLFGLFSSGWEEIPSGRRKRFDRNWRENLGFRR